MRKLLNITINTDASFNSDYKVGGFAFYIISDVFKIMKGGTFKVQPKNSIEAEIMAIANAVYTLLQAPELRETKLIVINSDCLNAFRRITLKNPDLVGRKTAKLIKELRNKTAQRGAILPDFEFRHVKAHNGTPDARSYVNDWCDRTAKKYMRETVAELKLKA